MSALPEARPSFVPMCESDLDAVAAAEAAIYEFPWSRGNFSDALGAGYSAWVGRCGASLAGYGIVMCVLDEAHLLNISVAGAWRGRGWGQALLDHLMGVARGAGARSLFLEVRPSNETAIAFYRRNGFRQIGRRRGYYPAREGREDAIVLRTEL